MAKEVERRTLFMVTTGWYSDYSVVGVFTTRELAQEFIETFQVGDVNDIDEIDLNPGINETRKGLEPFRVMMRRDGSVIESAQCDRERYYAHTSARIMDYRKTPPTNPLHGQRFLNALVWARDEKHAVKIVGEKRRQIIAEGGWDAD